MLMDAGRRSSTAGEADTGVGVGVGTCAGSVGWGVGVGTCVGVGRGVGVDVGVGVMIWVGVGVGLDCIVADVADVPQEASILLIKAIQRTVVIIFACLPTWNTAFVGAMACPRPPA